MLVSWLVLALAAKSPPLQSSHSSLHLPPSVFKLYVAQQGITDNTTTFGTRNISNSPVLMLPASSAKTVTVERVLKGMGGETRQTHLEWFCTTMVFTG